MSKHYQATVYHQSKYFPRHPPHLSPPMSAAPGCTVEKMCKLKGPLEAQWHCILYHKGAWWNCSNPSWRCKQFEISWRPKHSTGQKTSLCMWRNFSHGHYLWYEAAELQYQSSLCDFIWEFRTIFLFLLSPRLWQWSSLCMGRTLLTMFSLLQWYCMSLIQSWSTIMACCMYHMLVLHHSSLISALEAVMNGIFLF